MPLLEKERKVKGLKNLAIPKCFYAHPEPGVLVMKNLKDDFFDLRKNQPKSMSHISQDVANIVFMKSLSSLHASTHHLVQQKGIQWFSFFIFFILKKFISIPDIHTSINIVT